MEKGLGAAGITWVEGEEGKLLPELPQLRFTRTRGHTEGLMVLDFQGKRDSCLYPADLIPHRGFLKPKKDPLADLDPDLALKERTSVLAQAKRRGANLWFYHDLDLVFGKLLGETGEGVYRLQE